MDYEVTDAEGQRFEADDRIMKLSRKRKAVAFQNQSGYLYHSTIEEFLVTRRAKLRHGKVQLLLTSPPFPLSRQKSYGNLSGSAYLEWITSLAPQFRELISPQGSIVIEIGNAWEKGVPIMSTLPTEALLKFKEAGKFHLCQEFIVHNPARLPSPAQWVNVKRTRVKDSFSRIWWLSPSIRPKASNRRVLIEYSDAMKRLLATGAYNSGRRPSEHYIGTDSFLKNNKGAIPSNVLIAANTSSNDSYLRSCKSRRINAHPARMPIPVAAFFIKLLTTKDDLVFDPFAGSDTTGYVAETLGRRWLSVEPIWEYVRGAYIRHSSHDSNVSQRRR